LASEDDLQSRRGLAANPSPVVHLLLSERVRRPATSLVGDEISPAAPAVQCRRGGGKGKL
jgi:hypothetical protein